MILVDIFWAKYNMATAAREPMRAGLWSAAIVLGGAFTFISYTEDHRMLVPAALGAYVGTYYAVWKEKKRAKPAG